MKMTKDSLLKIIGAADEVISALADTNDEVHKDDTDKMVRLWDGLNDKYAPPEVVRELARMALGAMDSEPVYQCEFTHAADSGELQWHWEDVNEAFYEQYGSGPRGRRRILYSAPQPGPVADSEPVAEVLSSRPGNDTSTIDRALPVGTQLYRHAQPAPASEPVFFIEVEGDDWINAGRISGSTFDFNNLPDGINNLYAAPQPAPDRDQVRREHAEWSQATFGNVGPIGPLKHLRREVKEVIAKPHDLSEWADMQFLMWDAQRRAGFSDEQITRAMVEKLALNKARQWPEPKEGEPRLHIKEQPAPVAEREPIAWLNDAYLARGVVDGEAGSEDAGPGYIPVYREAGPQPVPVELRNHFRAEGLAEVLKDAREYAPLTATQWETLAKNWHQTFVGLSGEESACRAAMLQTQSVCTCPSGDGSLLWPCPSHPGNSPVIPDGWQLVPVEPNGNRLAAAQDAYGETEGDIASTLRAAIAAAPQEVKGE